MAQLVINGTKHTVTADPDTPMLWVLRDLGLTGTKYGCGVAQCGACTIHIDGEAVRSCSLPLSAMQDGQTITTIEALGEGGHMHALQKAWIELDVPQCGYCQSGQLMAAAALLAKVPNPTDAQIDEAMTNICRCGTYNRIRAGIKLAASSMTKKA